jgi:hypothetical protein
MIVTGCFVKKYEIWTSPPDGQHWGKTSCDTNARPVFKYESKEIADAIVKVLTWCTCKDISIKEIYEPVSELPLITEQL